MNLIESFVNKIASAVRTDSMLIRTFALLAVVSLLALGFMEYIRRVWRDNFELRAQGDNGAVVFHSSYDDGFRKVVFLVPASQCWINTKLDFEPGETIKFTTSGKVHLAMNQIKQEELAIIHWSKPDGSPFLKPIAGGDRSQFLICHREDEETHRPLVGNLIGFLQVDGIDSKPGPLNPHPIGVGKNSVFHIGHEQSIRNETGHKASLWLSVNDIVLDSSVAARQAYLGDSAEFVRKTLEGQPLALMRKIDQQQEAKAIWAKHLETWKSICDAQQWDLYFNDNIGTYLVFIEKKTGRGS